MKHVIISLFIGLAVLVASCSKSVTTSSSKPERIEASTPSSEHIQVPVPGDETPPPDFAPYEKAPQIIKRTHPIYPEKARKAGLNGTVWVKIWVDKSGKPLQVIIQKSDSDVFDQAAIDAAKQLLFTPALRNGEPVDCWVSLPFHFRTIR
jgi:protein TonB